MSGYHFKYHDTRPKSCSQPVGFYNYKAKQVYKTSLPAPNHGTHVRLHDNLIAKWRRPDTCGNKLAYGPTFRILYSQRQRQKIYTGQAPTDMYTASSTTRKLASYDPLRQPPESSIFKDMLYYPHAVCNKPLYSKSEVQSIVDRLYSRKKREGREPALLMLDKTRKSYPAEMVEELVEMYGSTNRLCPNPPFRNLFRDRTKAHEMASSKKFTDEQVDTIVNRLQEFDIQKWPPNSSHVKTSDPASPVPRKYPPPNSATTQRSIDATTDRLYNSRWKADDSDDNKFDDEEEESDAEADNNESHQKAEENVMN